MAHRCAVNFRWRLKLPSSCTCHRVKWGTGCRWTDVIPVMRLSGFGQPCIHNGNLFLLHLFFILLLIIFFAACRKDISMPQCPIWKMSLSSTSRAIENFLCISCKDLESGKHSMKPEVNYIIRCDLSSFCLLPTISFIYCFFGICFFGIFLWSSISLWFPTFPMWKGDVL